MQKETILAVVVGLLFGLGVTFAVYLVRSPQESQRLDASESQLVEVEPEEEVVATESLIIDSPSQDLITSDQEILVSGKTVAGSYVVVFMGDVQEIVTAQESGDFLVSLSLKEGPNFLTIIATDQDGNSTSVERIVVYEKELPIEEESE